jgi:glycosyltransferase involved in cell wall biosynthesis
MVAVEVMREINRRGIPARLTVVGCSPDLVADGVPDTNRAMIEVVGRLNKTVPQELAKLQSLYLESDFFIMPSRAESLGVVYIEAMACGLPSLATATGGIATAVRDGVTGRIVEWGDKTANELADYAIQTRNDSDGYKDICRRCAQIFETEYRWEVGFRKLGEIFEQLTRLTRQHRHLSFPSPGTPGEG